MALFSNTSEFTAYEKLVGTTPFEVLLPYIETAETSYIKLVLGPDQYHELHLAYQNSIKPTSPTPLDQEEIDLLHQARRALAQLTMFEALPTLAVNVSNMGITRHESEDKKSAYEYQEVRLRRAKLSTGLRMLDDLEEFLEEYHALYPVYFASTTYSDRFKYFVRSAKEFNEFTPLHINRFTYLKLQSVLGEFESETLRPTLGASNFDQLKTEWMQGTATATDLQTVKKMQRASVKYALKTALIKLTVKIDALGITVFEDSDTKTMAARKPAELERLRALADEYAQEADALVSDIEELASGDSGTDSSTQSNRAILDNEDPGWSAL